MPRPFLLAACSWRSSSMLPRLRRTTTKSRFTGRRRFRQKRPWWSCTATSSSRDRRPPRTAFCPPNTSCTRRSRSRRASRPGSKPASISLQPCPTVRAGSGWATTSGREYACRQAGTGRSASACPPSSGTRGPSFRAPFGVLRSGRSSTSRRAACTGPSIPHSRRPYTGPESRRGWEFSPDAKISWNFTKVVAFGLEYYSGFGPVGGVDPFPYQAQQFIPAFDLDVSPKWEINFGLGVGVTRVTDHMLFKAIIGRRFDWGKRASACETAKTRSRDLQLHCVSCNSQGGAL